MVITKGPSYILLVHGGVHQMLIVTWGSPDANQLVLATKSNTRNHYGTHLILTINRGHLMLIIIMLLIKCLQAASPITVGTIGF